MLNLGEGRLERLGRGGRPRVMDLFSGCGGLSLGFEAAGFMVAGGIDADSHAAATHAAAFHGDASPDLRRAFAVPRDITETDPKALCRELGLGEPHEGVDVLVGGPPCQAFARIGRAKLRQVARDPRAFITDPRAGLYTRYLDFVREVRPLAIVMENVPDLMNHDGRNIAEEICDLLEQELGYLAGYSLLNSAWYGVPQIRERCFIVALHSSLGQRIRFPEPGFGLELPGGYLTARAHAKALISPMFEGHFVGCGPDGLTGLRPAVTAEEALGDLPPLQSHLDGQLTPGRRDLSAMVRCRQDVQLSDYSRRMREWKGRETHGVTDAHVTRILNRDHRTFARMAEGDEYPAALRVAEARFTEHLEGLSAGGAEPPVQGTEEWTRLRSEFVPPYDAGKFRNKWWKLRRDRPVRTLMAHIGKDTYSHIHYDGDQGRTITVREAARLQSFPDGFRFPCSMNHAFRQIGNAVPPLMAEAVAGEVMKALVSAAGAVRSAA